MLLNEHSDDPLVDKASIEQVFPVFLSNDTRDALVELCQQSSSDLEGQKVFAQKVVQYTRDFLLRYPQVAEALFIGEELGGKAKQDRFHAKAVNKYTGRDVRRGDIWNGAGEHSLAVGMLAEILAQKMKLPDASVQRIAMAGALHDWWKKHEIMHLWDAEDQLKAGNYDLTAKNTMNNPAVIAEIREAFDTAKQEDQNGLRALGVPEDVIELAGASRIRTKKGPQTDEELIIFFLDFVMAGVRPTDMLGRISEALSRHSTYTAYENSYRDDLGGRTIHEALLHGMGHDIIERIAGRIGYHWDLNKIDRHLTNLFVEAVNKIGES